MTWFRIRLFTMTTKTRVVLFYPFIGHLKEGVGKIKRQLSKRDKAGTTQHALVQGIKKHFQPVII